MEGNVFTAPAVAGILEEKFVESRLHLETYEGQGGEAWDRFAALRDKYAESVAMPTYAIVRPSDGERIGWHQLQGGPTSWIEELRTFLESALSER